MDMRGMECFPDVLIVAALRHPTARKVPENPGFVVVVSFERHEASQVRKPQLSNPEPLVPPTVKSMQQGCAAPLAPGRVATPDCVGGQVVRWPSPLR